MDRNEEIKKVSELLYNNYIGKGWKNVSLECCERKAINYIDVRDLVKKLIIGDVVSSFFTDSDVGNEFEIIANTSGHGFNIGEIVTLLETNADPNDDEYKFAGKDDYWWCNFADIKTK